MKTKAENTSIQSKHAFLSASKAKRWIGCPPSAKMESQMPDSEASNHMKEGSLAHKLAEIELRFLYNHTKHGIYTSHKAKVFEDPLFTEDMPQYVQQYIDYVQEQISRLQKEDSVFFHDFESKIDLSFWVPEGFGTVDIFIANQKNIEVIDLKYGKGVKVYATDNAQLKLYVAGAVKRLDFMTDIKTVKYTIVQPRLNHISSEEINVKDLLHWCEKTVKPAAKKAFVGKGNFKVDVWCQFCKAQTKCKAFNDYNLEIAKTQFLPPEIMSDDGILDAYNQSKFINQWVKNLNDYVLKKAIEGKKWEGLKLVTGKSNRKWRDEKQIINTFFNQNFKEEEYLNKKLKGIGEIEKLQGGKGLIEKYDMTIKPEGKPTLVNESDIRIPFGNERAKEIFKKE